MSCLIIFNGKDIRGEFITNKPSQSLLFIQKSQNKQSWGKQRNPKHDKITLRL